jgi:hypothetical protein
MVKGALHPWIFAYVVVLELFFAFGLSKLLSLFRGREPTIMCATLALFSILQVIPYAFPGDTAITGEGRIFALHIFDAQVVCNSNIVVRRKDGTLSRLNLIPKLPVLVATRLFTST